MDPNDRVLLVRHEEAERLDTLGVRLYADHDTTGGALSGNRAYLPAGADGVNAVWTYEQPYDAVADIREHVAFYPDKVSIEIIAD